MSGYRTMGHLLTIDYDHASLDPKPLDPAKSKKSGGVFDVELRNGECWATKIQFTPEAADGIRRKEWPFISPAFRSDEKTGRILLLLNFALTANPALFGAPHITAASVIEFQPYPLSEDDDWEGPVLEAQSSGELERAGTSIDITDFKQAQRALRESEERFRGTFESAAGMLLIDPMGRIVAHNEKFARMFGRSAEESLIGLSGFDTLAWAQKIDPSCRRYSRSWK